MRYILAAALAALATSALACDDFKSTKDPSRLLHFDRENFSLTLVDHGKETHLMLQSAGTGTGIMLAVDPATLDANQVTTPDGQFWLGPERFDPNCK